MTHLDELTDDELLTMQGAIAREVALRGRARGHAELVARGLDPTNGSDRLQLNVKTLAGMGRDSKGAPLPPKAKKAQ